MRNSPTARLLVSALALAAGAGTARATEPPVKPVQDLLGPIAIRGTVVDESGKPVADAQIEEVGHAWRHEHLGTRSDAAGNFVLASRIPNFSRALVARDFAGGRVGTCNCVFSNSAEPLRIVVRPPREILVRVADGQGRPVPNAKVAVTALRMTAAAQKELTDATGTATLRVPRDLAVQSVFAFKDGVGFDYVTVRQPRLIGQQPRRLRAPEGKPAPADIPSSVTLVLDGAQRVRVHVVNENHAPLAGLRIRAVGIQRPGQVPVEVRRTDGDEFVASTDAAGVAEIRTIPLKREPGINFVCDTSNYSLDDTPFLDRTAAVCDVRLVAHPSRALHLLVTLPDGRAAVGAQLDGSYRFVSGSGIGTWSSLCDEEGKWQFPELEEDAVGVVSASISQLASPITRFVAHKGQPIPPIHLVVRPATRVHGTLTYGKERQPISAETITLRQLEGAAADRAAPRESSNGSAMELSRSRKTDRLGRFEFFAAPGRYSIGIGSPVFVMVIDADMMGKSVPLEQGAKKFEIKDQKEIEVDFANARPPSVEFDGRVVLESDPKRGVAGATVHVAPIDPRNEARFRPVRTDADGAFHAERRPCEMLVEAVTEEGTSSGLVRVFAYETNVTIPIGPGASARGVIVDATTGRPVDNQRIICGIRLDFPQGGFRLAAPAGAVTNRQGEFDLTGLPRGWKFECYAQVGARNQPTTRFVRLGEFTTDQATIDLGRMKLSTVQGTPPGDSKGPL